MNEVKRVSSIWLKKQEGISPTFDWQDGYAVFSISHSDCPDVSDYISRQEEHYGKVNFQDEMRTFMKRTGMEWDENYFRD